MTPDRFNECLKLLHWDTEALAHILECDASLTKAWAQGLDDIPYNLAEWLDTLGMVHYLVDGNMPRNLKGKSYAATLSDLRR